MITIVRAVYVYAAATCNFGATLYFPGFRAYLSKLVERTETGIVSNTRDIDHYFPVLCTVH